MGRKKINAYRANLAVVLATVCAECKAGEAEHKKRVHFVKHILDQRLDSCVKWSRHRPKRKALTNKGKCYIIHLFLLFHFISFHKFVECTLWESLGSHKVHGFYLACFPLLVVCGECIRYFSGWTPISTPFR